MCFIWMTLNLRLDKEDGRDGGCVGKYGDLRQSDPCRKKEAVALRGAQRRAATTRKWSAATSCEESKMKKVRRLLHFTTDYPLHY